MYSLKKTWACLLPLVLPALAFDAPDPSVEQSINSIFSSLRASSSQHGILSGIVPLRATTTSCCGRGCCLGCCNNNPDFETRTDFSEMLAATGTAVQSFIQARPTPTTVSLPCCSRSCPDGACKIPQVTPFPTAGRLSIPQLRSVTNTNCQGIRDCTNGLRLTLPAPLAKPTSTVSIPGSDGSDVTGKYYEAALAGKDQDYLPIVLQSGAGQALTVLAALDLSLTENYISHSLVQDLNRTSELTKLPVLSIAPIAVLGSDALDVTVISTLALDLLAGPDHSLRRFGGTEFNVFDPPAIGLLEPDLLLGLNFLRRAAALTTTKEYAHGAVRGLPVLVQEVVETMHKLDDTVKHEEL